MGGYLSAVETLTSYLDEAAKKGLLNRLSRIEGQVRALEEMVREDVRFPAFRISSRKEPA